MELPINSLGSVYETAVAKTGIAHQSVTGRVGLFHYDARDEV